MSTVLQAKERKEFRNSNLTDIRQKGNIPAIVYGSKMESTPIYLSGAEFHKTIKTVGRNGIISLDVDGNKHEVILNDYQADPIKNEVIHVDFLAVDMNKELTANVRVDLVGDALGVKDGGVMQQSLHDISITAKPNNLPPSIEIDISNLQVGETITIGQIKASSEFRINHDEEEVIASILAPRQEEEINSGEQQASGAPVNEEGRESEPTNGEEV